MILSGRVAKLAIVCMEIVCMETVVEHHCTPYTHLMVASTIYVAGCHIGSSSMQGIYQLRCQDGGCTSIAHTMA